MSHICIRNESQLITFTLLFGRRSAKKNSHTVFFFYVLNSQCTVLIIIFCRGDCWILLKKRNFTVLLIKISLNISSFLEIRCDICEISRVFYSFIYLFFFFFERTLQRFRNCLKFFYILTIKISRLSTNIFVTEQDNYFESFYLYPSTKKIIPRVKINFQEFWLPKCICN